MKTGAELNKEIAAVFFEKARTLEEKGESQKFRSIAYYRAARAIEQEERGMDEIYQHGWLTGLQKIKGIGNRIAHDIEAELLKKGFTRK